MLARNSAWLQCLAAAEVSGKLRRVRRAASCEGAHLTQQNVLSLTVRGCSELTTLAQQLASIAPALAAAVAVCAPGGPPLQLSAATVAATACGLIAFTLPLRGADALRIASAARVVLVAGRAALETGTVRFRHNDAFSAQLQASAGLQLAAMDSLMDLMSSAEHPTAAAAFARSTAAPEAFMPWLTAVNDALLLSPTSWQGRFCLGRGRLTGCCRYVCQLQRPPPPSWRRRHRRRNYSRSRRRRCLAVIGSQGWMPPV